ncbi:MAG: hypothetical protein N2484_12810 [Clostridia bacterium]|nr:hypothetical protein [Clostridia bacterium]
MIFVPVILHAKHKNISRIQLTTSLPYMMSQPMRSTTQPIDESLCSMNGDGQGG